MSILGGAKKATTNDLPVFDTKWKAYKARIEQLKTLEKDINNHLEMTKKYVESCSKISVQIAFFFQGCEDKVARRTRVYGQLNHDLQTACMESVAMLYEKEVLKPLEVLWELDKDMHKAVKERKKLIKSQSDRQKALQKKTQERDAFEAALKEEAITGKEKKGGIFGKKKKDITELGREVVIRKTALDEAEEKQEEFTQLIIKKFDSMEASHFNGELISSPVSGVMASQYHLALETVERLRHPRKQFREQEVFIRTLRAYDEANAKGLSIDDQQVTVAKGFVFGRMLTHPTPDVVCDCIQFIKQGIKCEGLFRIPGNRTNVEAIQASYDQQENQILNLRTDIDIHDVCSTLKYFFNMLPEPLIPYNTYEELESYFANEGNQNFEDHAVVAIVQNVPNPQLGLLGLLLNFLYDVSKFHKINQMTTVNLATCFAPALLKPRPVNENGKANNTQLKSMKNIAANIATVTTLIDNARKFKVPKESVVEQHTHLEPDTMERVQRTCQQMVEVQQKNNAEYDEPDVSKPDVYTPVMNQAPPLPDSDEQKPMAPPRVQASNRTGHTFSRNEIAGLVQETQSRKKRPVINRGALQNEGNGAAMNISPPPGLKYSSNIMVDPIESEVDGMGFLSSQPVEQQDDTIAILTSRQPPPLPPARLKEQEEEFDDDDSPQRLKADEIDLEI